MPGPQRWFVPDEVALRALGAQFGRAARAGDVIALLGPLGAGKTTFAQGFAAALGVAGPVPSPTFVLVRQYDARLPLAHIDAYRLDGAADAWAAGLDELLGGDGVCLVEWADRIAELLDEGTLTLTIEILESGRAVTVDGNEVDRWLET